MNIDREREMDLPEMHLTKALLPSPSLEDNSSHDVPAALGPK